MRRIRAENSTQSETLGRTLGDGAFGAARLGRSGACVWKDGVINFDKVRYLIDHRVLPSRPGYRLAWPDVIGVDPTTGEPIAYAMNFADDGIDTMRLFSPVNVGSDFRIRVALNHVRSLLDLEACGYRRGDVPNSVFHRDASITEFDLDSLQVSRPDARFNGGFFKALTVPPELIEHFESGGGPGFEVTREHDAWVAAVLVWLLLMEGEHPFDFRWRGAGKRPNRMEVLKAGLWPHSGLRSEVEPRPGAKRFGSLDAELQVLFEKTFVHGHPTVDPKIRPTLAAWEAALARLDGGDARMKLSTLQWDALKGGDTLPPSGSPPSLGQIGQMRRSSWRTACTVGVLAVGGGIGAASLGLLPTSAAPQTTTQSLPPAGAATPLPSESTVAAPGAKKAVPAPRSAGASVQPLVPPRRPLVELSALPTTPAGKTPALWRELERKNQ